MTTAIILPDLGGGGAQRVMLQVAAGLRDAGLGPRLLVLGGSQAFAGDLPPGIPVEIGRAARVREGLPWLIRRLRAMQPRVAISVMGYLNLALLAARAALPRGMALIVREANVLAATTEALPRWLPRSSLYRRLYGRAAAVVAPAAAVGEELRAAVPNAAGRIHLIPNPVDVVGLRTRARSPRREQGAGLRLVAAGRLTRQKGFDRLIPVLAALPADARLTLFGSGPEEAKLRTGFAGAGSSAAGSPTATGAALASRITFAGFSSDLPAWIAGADAFLLPSRWEGLPNVVLESLALGTPVIASPEAAVTEVATAAPPGAVTIAKPESEFASVITRVLPISAPPSAPRLSLLPAAYETEAVIEQWVELLTGVMAGRLPATSIPSRSMSTA